MTYSPPHFVSQIVADSKQPGYQGPLELISFVIVSAMITSAFITAMVLLLYAI